MMLNFTARAYLAPRVAF